LAQAIKELFVSKSEIKVIGTRHGEKIYETLMTEEENMKAIDLGEYFRIPMDGRDLNYEKYFTEGDHRISSSQAYTSHNTKILNIEQIKEKLLMMDYVRNELAEWRSL